MKAMILAAGLGSRLQHKTHNRPKALVELNGNPILFYQIDNLAKAGISEVVIVIGYLGKQIINYVEQTFKDINFIFIENKEYKTSNSSYSFWQAKELLIGQSYLHLNCDIIFSGELLNKIIQAPHNNAIAVRKDLLLTDNMENIVLENDRIIQMSIKRSPLSVGKAFGLAKLSSESTDFIIILLEKYINQGDKNQNYYGMIREAVKSLDYRAIYSDTNNLLEINTTEDFIKAEKILCHTDFQN